jgi:hypothetical protein
VEPAIVQDRVHSSKRDGITEIFKDINGEKKFLEDIETILKRAKPKDYSALVNYDKQLDYHGVKHLVAHDKIWFPYIDSLLHKPAYAVQNHNTCLLIGSFDECIICGLKMMYNTLVILSDDSDNYKASLTAFVTDNNNICFVDAYNEIEALNMKFDLIISNPPYGPIGINITQAIIDNINYGTFVNLLPATNYRLSKTDLQKHVKPEELETVLNAFSDAAVLPTVGLVYKDEVNNLTPQEFRIEMQQDPLTKRYFYENIKRKPTCAEMLDTQSFAKEADLSFANVIFLPMRTASGAHSDLASLSRGTKGLPYRVAMGLVSCQSEVGKNNPQCGTYVRFSTEEEKKNCGEFLFGDGFKFILWLLNSMRVDVANKAEHEVWFPRVDWRRKYTPREILEEYGYSEEEIAQIEEKMTEYPELSKKKGK